LKERRGREKRRSRTVSYLQILLSLLSAVKKGRKKGTIIEGGKGKNEGKGASPYAIDNARVIHKKRILGEKGGQSQPLTHLHSASFRCDLPGNGRPRKGQRLLWILVSRSFFLFFSLASCAWGIKKGSFGRKKKKPTRRSNKPRLRVLSPYTFPLFLSFAEMG